MRSASRGAALVLAWAVASASFAGLAPRSVLAQARPTLRVLFVGNSHTYTHDVPGMVEALADSANDARPRVVATSVTIPGACLAEHERVGSARRALAAGGYDVVVLQECGGGVARRRARYHRHARALFAAIGGIGARTVLAMVHRYRDGANGTTAAIARSVRALARELAVPVAPHAVAWESLRRAAPSLVLFEPDGFHPSVLGAYLHACTTYATLTCTSPEGLTRTTPSGTVAPEAARLAWHAAWSAVQAERAAGVRSCLDPVAPAG